MLGNVDSTKRFSDRVDAYVRYRPDYPAAIVPFLSEAVGLTDGSVVGDVGSGTGKLTRLFLDNGNRVVAVEPNAEMRGAAERLFGDRERFRSVDGTAGATTLEDACVDLVVVGQAFHWFDPGAARVEFCRILKPGGFVCLIWNSRDTGGASPFSRDYEAMLCAHAIDYKDVRQRNIDDATFDVFFGPGGYRLETFGNSQSFDFEGLRGRLLSSSYAPTEGHPSHAPMMAESRRVFDTHQVDGRVAFEYATEVYYGRLG